MAIFIDHVNSVLQKLRETPITELSTDTATEAYRVQIATRRAVWRVWNARQWSFKLRQHSFPTVSGQTEYVLPKAVGQASIIKSSQPPYRLEGISEDMFDRYVPNPTASGNAQFYRLYEMGGAQNQPSSASTLSITSNSASDTTQKVFIKGLVNSEVDTEEVSLAGTGTVSTTKSFSAVYAITKSAETEGNVTVTAGATTIGRLAPQEKVLRLRILRLYPTPGSVYTITVKHFALPPLLTKAYEDTEIPTHWDYIIEQYAFAMALQPKGQEQITEQAQQFGLADKFLNEDMASEEQISAEKLILPERWGGTGDFGWLNSLDGFGYTYY